MVAEPHVCNFFYLSAMFVKPSVKVFSAFLGLLLVYSCTKPDDEVKGCVYGKTKGNPSEFNLGCMTRAEFNRYIQNPTGNIQGIPINSDIRFVQVEDCLECR